jgi:hypothetical protein
MKIRTIGCKERCSTTHLTNDSIFEILFPKTKMLIGKIVEEAILCTTQWKVMVQCITSNKSFQLEVLSIVFLLVSINL